MLKKCVNFIQREIDLQKQAPATHYGTRSSKGGSNSANAASSKASASTSVAMGPNATKSEAPGSGMLTRNNARKASTTYDETSMSNAESRSEIKSLGADSPTEVAADMQNAEVIFANCYDKSYIKYYIQH